MIVAAIVLALVWSPKREAQPLTIPVPPKVHTVAELKTLPGSPANVLSARVSGFGYDEARRVNAAMPFAATAVTPARPFPTVANATDRVRATDCLAIAAMAEAGADDDGQRAVIQVVLNRVLHPAFAKTICGVVFEGSHRATGCQFSFTCDGALSRRHSPAAWSRARTRAGAALDGAIYAPVGFATHYHTDWVHPYWSDSLTKIARVDTHLFFRWPGYWGSAAVYSIPYRGGEPAIPQLGYLATHSDPNHPLAAPVAGQTVDAAALRDIVVRNNDGGAFVLLTSVPSAISARDMGRGICGDRVFCKVLGWFDRAAIPSGYPIPATARAQLGFSYFRNGENDEIILYNCARFAGASADACIPTAPQRQAALAIEPAPAPAPAPVAMTALHAVAGKDGLVPSIARDGQAPVPVKESL